MFMLMSPEELEKILYEAIKEVSAEEIKRLLTEIVTITEITDRKKLVLGGDYNFNPKKEDRNNKYQCLLLIGKTEYFDKIVEDTLKNYLRNSGSIKPSPPVKIKIS